MNRSFWLFVFGAATVMGFMAHQNTARADDAVSVLPIMLESSAAPAAEEAPTPSCVDCAPSCAPSCMGCCCPCRHWVVGAEAVFLTRNGDLGLASYDITDGTTVSSSYSVSDLAPNYGMAVSPRIMLGIQGECWGMDIRYWRMREMDNFNDLGVAAATSGSGTYAESIFKAETLDLEATRLFYVGETQFQAAFGVRYAQLEQSSFVNVWHPLNGDYYNGAAFSDHGFHGAGLTGALTAVRPLNCRFSLFCNLRASILWDNNPRNTVYTRATYLDPTSPAVAGAFDGAEASGSGNLFIGEVQIGGQWDMPLKCIRANAFLRGAFEYQYWGTSDTGLAGCYSAAGVVGGDYGLAQAQSTNNYVNLVGFNLGTGLTW